MGNNSNILALFLAFFAASLCGWTTTNGSRVSPKGPTLRSDILSKTISATEASSDEEADDGGLEAIRILKWAEKRGLGPAAITPAMIRQRRSSSEPVSSQMATEATPVAKENNGISHKYTELVEMLETNVFVFPDQAEEDHQVQTKEADTNLPNVKGLVRVPSVQDIVRAMKDQDYESEPGREFWNKVFQMSDDLMVSTFLRVQNFPHLKAQHYLDQYIAASAASNDDLQTDIIVDILTSKTYDSDEPRVVEPGPGGVGGGGDGLQPSPQQGNKLPKDTTAQPLKDEGKDFAKEAVSSEDLATPLPFSHEFEDSDPEATVEDAEDDSSSATSHPLPAAAAINETTTTTRPSTIASTTEAFKVDPEAGQLNAHNRGASAKLAEEATKEATEPKEKAVGQNNQDNHSSNNNNSIASDRSDNLGVRTFEWTRARGRASPEVKEEQIRTIKLKVHKSVEVAGPSSGSSSQEERPQARLSGYYEGYLIVDIRIALIFVCLWIFLLLIVLVKSRLLSTTSMIGLLKRPFRGRQVSLRNSQGARKEL